nr:hypothetical protein [Tanacetum cinerariifolium]
MINSPAVVVPFGYYADVQQDSKMEILGRCNKFRHLVSRKDKCDMSMAFSSPTKNNGVPKKKGNKKKGKGCVADSTSHSVLEVKKWDEKMPKEF